MLCCSYNYHCGNNTFAVGFDGLVASTNPTETDSNGHKIYDVENKNNNNDYYNNNKKNNTENTSNISINNNNEKNNGTNSNSNQSVDNNDEIKDKKKNEDVHSKHYNSDVVQMVNDSNSDGSDSKLAKNEITTPKTQPPGG